MLSVEVEVGVKATIERKIVILAHYSGLYGANISLLAFLVNTQFDKSQIIIICPEEGKLTERLKELEINYFTCKFKFNVSDGSKAKPVKARSIHAIKKAVYLNKLYRLIKRLRPTLLYSNSSVIYYGFFIAKLLRIPHVWHIREFGKMDYGYDPDFGFKFQKSLLRKNSFNIAISNSIANYFDLKPKNSKIIYNGVVEKVELEKFDNYSSFSSNLRFGIVGFITPYKNQLKLLEAFSKFNKNATRKATLYIIGTGQEEYLSEIRRFIQEHSLSKDVILTGKMEDIKEIYSSFDILLHGAKYEGFGRVTAEAMSFGKVPIGLNHSGTSEIIEHNKTGILFDDFEELPLLLNHLNNNRDILIQLQKNMILNFNTKFTTEYYSSEIEDILKKLQVQKSRN